MDAPAWLQDEPEILALLGAVLDRFDQQSGEARSRSIHLPAMAQLPSLTRGDELADQIWSLVQALSQMGVLRIRLGRRSPYDAEWHDAKLAFAPTCEAVLREWLNRPAERSAMQLWREAVEQHAHAFPAGHELLLTRRISVPGRSAGQVVAALATLGSVRRPATLRQLSTRMFWGDSKVLDDRGELLAALFPNLQIRERPIVVAVYLPEHIDGVLFIENQDNYSAAIDGEPAAGRHHAMVYMAGFRGTALRIRSRDGARLHFAGPGLAQREIFERWWCDAAALTQHRYFWGDLDFASMQMLKSLRQRFGEVEAWRPGYEPMLAELLAAGRGSRLDNDKGGQVDPLATGCEFADTVLLPAVREHGYWDQERMTD